MTPVLIAEDEKYAGQHLQHLLREIAPQLQVVAIAERVEDAIAAIRRFNPALLLLDINLADDLSFRIFDTIAPQIPVIFTTAYDQYAIQAFKANGIDYLLKPIDKLELKTALDKFERLSTAFLPQQITALLKQYQSAPATQAYRQRFLVNHRQQLISLTTNQIAYFEGEDRYVHLTLITGERYLIDDTLQTLEQTLDPAIFLRVNRSFMVQHQAVAALQMLGKGRLQLQLNPPARREVIISATQAGAVKAWLNG
ncbi:MAG: DNA-binding response regulator [Bacteroidetes bacterium]|nr:MAG: DNA-binding response regulator [Bacteroidota bacterium]